MFEDLISVHLQKQRTKSCSFSNIGTAVVINMLKIPLVVHMKSLSCPYIKCSKTFKNILSNWIVTFEFLFCWNVEKINDNNTIFLSFLNLINTRNHICRMLYNFSAYNFQLNSFSLRDCLKVLNVLISKRKFLLLL